MWKDDINNAIHKVVKGYDKAATLSYQVLEIITPVVDAQRKEANELDEVIEKEFVRANEAEKRAAELEAQNKALVTDAQECRAERAHYGDMVTERLLASEKREQIMRSAVQLLLDSVQEAPSDGRFYMPPQSLNAASRLLAVADGKEVEWDAGYEAELAKRKAALASDYA